MILSVISHVKSVIHQILYEIRHIMLEPCDGDKPAVLVICRPNVSIRLRLNSLRLAAGMNGEVNRAVARRAKAGWL